MQNIFPILSHDRSLLIKIGDFGSAKIPSVNDQLVTAIGTPEYMAPEILGGSVYTHAVDIWSLGCLSFTLLTGKSFFPDRKTFYTYVFHPDGYKNHSPREALLAHGITSEPVIDLSTRLLQIPPENRPSAEDALSHEWFNNPSGVETQEVTLELYNHFVKVLSGPRLQRLITVPPDILAPNPPLSSETISIIYLLW